MSCLTDLKSCGVADIFVVWVDGLSGFADAIRTAFPQTKVQRCIVHLVRAALRYVMDKDGREFVPGLKTIYQAATVLNGFDQKWGDEYPMVVTQWRVHWSDIIVMFEFPQAIRKAIYTTNAIESVNSVIRKFTRNRKQYPNGGSALKLVYLAIHEASKNMSRKAALIHFAILFEGRMPSPTGN